MIGITNAKRPEQFKGLKFTAEEANSQISYSISNYGSGEEPNIQYSYTGKTWEILPAGSTITLSNIGDKVYFKGNNPNGICTGVDMDVTSELHFVMSGTIAASGNINSLLDNADGSQLPNNEIPNDYCFYNLFYQCASLTTPPDLPATTLKPACYRNLFRDCINLTVAPELPALTVRGIAYLAMFDGCSSLTVAPALPGTSVSSRSYQQMFRNCTSLVTPPSTINATSFGYYTCAFMFNGCTALTSVPTFTVSDITSTYAFAKMFLDCSSITDVSNISLASTTLTNYCYSEMFENCISLTTVMSTLPAVTSAQYCYNHMFKNCQNITTAPEIFIAGTIANYALVEMFAYCHSLSYIKVHWTRAMTPNQAGYIYFQNWVLSVASSGDFYYNPSGAIYYGPSSVPDGWTVHNFSN